MRREPQAVERAADFDSGELRASRTLGPAGQVQDRGDVAEIGDPGVPAGPLDRVADKTAGGRKGETGEAGNGNEDGASALAKVEGSQPIAPPPTLSACRRSASHRRVGWY